MKKYVLGLAAALLLAHSPPAVAHGDYWWIAKGGWTDHLTGKSCCGPDDCSAGEIVGWYCESDKASGQKICYIRINFREGPLANKGTVTVRVHEQNFYAYSADSDRICHMWMSGNGHEASCAFRIPRFGERSPLPPSGIATPTKWRK